MPNAFANLQAQVGNIIGNLAIPGALATSLQPNAANTTTAVNLLIVVNGLPQGLIRTMTIDETFNPRNVPAINSAVDVANVPGIYRATATIDKAFLFGVTLEAAFGGSLRAVVGPYQSTPDFTKLYFSIVEVNNQGSILAARHDCLLASVRHAYDIESVVIFENANILIRWSTQANS
jgi:hypothetical protein